MASAKFGQLCSAMIGAGIHSGRSGIRLSASAIVRRNILGVSPAVDGTLSLRMQRHSDNALQIASWLEEQETVENVTYAGLKSSPYFDRVKMVCPKGAGGLFTVALKGGYDSCIKFVNALEIFSHVSNLGDSRSLVIHTASTTHRQLTEEQQIAAGSAPNVVRISIGIEDPEDLIADLKQALSAAK